MGSISDLQDNASRTTIPKPFLYVIDVRTACTLHVETDILWMSPTCHLQIVVSNLTTSPLLSIPFIPFHFCDHHVATSHTLEVFVSSFVNNLEPP